MTVNELIAELEKLKRNYPSLTTGELEVESVNCGDYSPVNSVELGYNSVVLEYNYNKKKLFEQS